MEDNAAVDALRQELADVKKENATLWEQLLADKKVEQVTGDAVLAQMEQAGALDAGVPKRLVSCPSCGAQHTVNGRCVHCGTEHEVWQPIPPVEG